MRYLLLSLLFPLASVAMEDAYKIVFKHKADNKPYIVKIYDRSKREQPILDREIQHGSDLQKIIEEAKNITVGIYENTPQGPKPVAAENFDLPGMNLHYTNLKEKIRGFIINIVKDRQTGKIQLVKDFETLVKEAGLQPSPAAPMPVTKPVSAPVKQYDKYELEAYNGHSVSNLKMELIAKNGRPIFKKAVFPYNERIKWDLDANDFPLLLKVDEWQGGKWVENVFVEEIDMPANNLPKLQFYFTFDTELRLKFLPNVAHGRAVTSVPGQTQATMQPRVKPLPATQIQAPVTSIMPARTQPVAAPSVMPSRQMAPVAGAKNEVILRNSSQLPRWIKLVTQSGRTLFEGTLLGIKQKPNNQTQVLSVSDQESPLKLITEGDESEPKTVEFLLSLTGARERLSKELAHLRSVYPNQKMTPKENQFEITFSDDRPVRTAKTDARIYAVIEGQPSW